MQEHARHFLIAGLVAYLLAGVLLMGSLLSSQRGLSIFFFAPCFAVGSVLLLVGAIPLVRESLNRSSSLLLVAGLSMYVLAGVVMLIARLLQLGVQASPGLSHSVWNVVTQAGLGFAIPFVSGTALLLAGILVASKDTEVNTDIRVWLVPALSAYLAEGVLLIILCLRSTAEKWIVLLFAVPLILTTIVILIGVVSSTRETVNQSVPVKPQVDR